MTTLDQAIAQMRAAGMPDFPDGHPRLNAGRITRYGPKKKAWYILYEYRSRNNRYYITGAYGLWRGPDNGKFKIETDWAGMEPDEFERVKRSQAELERIQAEKHAQRVLFAARRARAQWESARSRPPEGVATYLTRKGVEHEKGLRYFADGTLIVPMIRYDITEAQEEAQGYSGPRRLAGLQKIAPDGTKRFNKGMAAEAAMCRLGSAPKSGELILLTESVGTGLTLRMATKRRFAVFNAFSAGNLMASAKILRALYPKSPILFCADDDAYLASSLNKLLREEHGVAELVNVPCTAWRVKARAGEVLVSADWSTDADGVASIVGAVAIGERVLPFSRVNAGRTYAHRAAAEVGNSAVVYPQFVDRALPPAPDVSKLTDFNDLHAAEGINAVSAQLEREIERLELSQSVRALIREEVAQAARKPKKGAAAPPSGGGVAAHNDSFDWSEFFERYTLIYPTDTAWDAKYEKIVKLSAIKHAYSEGRVKFWLSNPEGRRRMVNEDDVVFDPTLGPNPPGKVNLFRGMTVQPSDKGSCAKLLELLHWLCNEDDKVFEWVLKWCALPLQRPGAKMRSAIVMHGPEGTGKNLFWSAHSAIYGQYGSIITQFQLQSQFNDWASRRLFIVANEVMTRMELRHLVGYLKNLVTEERVPIESKGLPVRIEDNRMQLVFLSNEYRPLHVAPGDRRYMVIKTPAGRAPDYYAAIAEEVAAGGVEALYHYLLNEVKLDDFTEHTRPLMTRAKSDLVELGLSSTQLFWQELHDALLDLPYVPCLVRDLFRAYQIYSSRIGEKNPAKLNQFSHEFMNMNGVTRRVDRVPDPDSKLEILLPREKLKQKTIFVMGHRPEDMDERSWIDLGVPTFRRALQDFHGRAERIEEDGFQYGQHRE